MEEKLPLFLVTVPHAACPLIFGGHPCDFDAPESAKKLFSFASGSGSFDARLVLSNVPRGFQDQNRVEGAGSEFNRTIVEAVKGAEARGVPSYVMDVHSYPEGAWGLKVRRDVFLMDPAERTGERSTTTTGYVEDLLSFLIFRGGDVGIIPGSSENYVVVRSREEGAISVLVEVNEDADEKKVEAILRNLVGWAQTREAKKRGGSALAF